MNSRGYTLIETAFSLGILVFLIFALFGIYLQFGNVYSLGVTSGSSIEGARRGMNSLITYTAQASQVLPSHTINNTAYSTNTSTLILKIPASDVNGSIIDSSWDYVVYFTTSSRLYQTIAPAVGSFRASSTRMIADSVFEAEFTFNTPIAASSTAITATLTTVSTERKVTVTSTLTDTMVLRNFSP